MAQYNNRRLMGNRSAKKSRITRYEYQEFSSISKFTEKEIKYLLLHFQSISKLHHDDGVIDYKEFLECLKLPDTLITQQIFKTIDLNGDNRINFREFILGLNFLMDEDQECLSNLVFKIFDLMQEKSFGITEMESVLLSSFKLFPGVKISQESLHAMLLRNLTEFRAEIHKKQKEVMLSRNSMAILKNIEPQLENLEAFRFDKESFHLYFKFHPLVFRMLSMSFELIKSNAKALS